LTEALKITPGECRLDPPWTGPDWQEGERIAQSRSTSVFRVPLAGGGAVFIKQYRFPTFLDGLRGMFRGTLFGRDKAQREFENLSRMKEKGWPVPRPLAVGREWGGLFLKACVLVTEEVEGAERADLFLTRHPPPSRRKRAEGIEAAAEGVARMHREGYADGSLALRNLLLKWSPGGCRIFKVDCRKGRWRTPVGVRALEDLARLDAGARPIVGLRDRLRFLRAYLGGRLGGRARRWIRAIERARRKYEFWEAPRLRDPGGPLDRGERGD
jgi:hypothetical protein